ncbi:MAG: hypothetical protein AAGF36_06625 [Pseudomonadota bacterium]
MQYRTGPFSVTWSDAGGTFSTGASAVRRVFRTDVLTDEGLYTELEQVTDVAACAATLNSWVADGGQVHVNVGGAPGAADVALIRSFHGARFVAHADDFYIEGFDIEGGITGALHCDAAADRAIVGVNCSFRYSAPSNPSAVQDAVRVRRTNGVAAFFGCDASMGAKDGWNFHEDGASQLQVLLQDCTSYRNGVPGASSVNGFTLHDGVRAVVLNGDFGWSRNGAEVHIIQDARLWQAGGRVVGRNPFGDAVAIQCSNDCQMWLQDMRADADGSAVNDAVRANGGAVFARGLTVVAGSINPYSEGSVTTF